VFIQVAILVADSNKQNFGLQQDELDKLAMSVLTAESQIRAIVRGRPTYERLRNEYF
jgi:hypothetical protein